MAPQLERQLNLQTVPEQESRQRWATAQGQVPSRRGRPWLALVRALAPWARLPSLPKVCHRTC
jgi:hypothetical protein